MRILGVDPGDTTGWAILEKGEPVEIGTLKKDEFYEMIPQILAKDIDVCVIEDYIVRPEWGNKWKKTDTPQKIGAIRLICTEMKLRCVVQQPSIKPVGYGWAGMTYVKGKKGTHVMDAIAHARYFYGKHSKN